MGRLPLGLKIDHDTPSETTDQSSRLNALHPKPFVEQLQTFEVHYLGVFAKRKGRAERLQLDNPAVDVLQCATGRYCLSSSGALAAPSRRSSTNWNMRLVLVMHTFGGPLSRKTQWKECERWQLKNLGELNTSTPLAAKFFPCPFCGVC